MRIRMHLDDLDESMATKKEIDPTLDAIAVYLREQINPQGEPQLRLIEVRSYCDTLDERILWPTTSLVFVDGMPRAMVNVLPEGISGVPIRPGRTDIDLHVLEETIHALTRQMNALLEDCTTTGPLLKAPSRKVFMQARASLPKGYAMSFSNRG